jgi:hypothetical protein
LAVPCREDVGVAHCGEANEANENCGEPTAPAPSRIVGVGNEDVLVTEPGECIESTGGAICSSKSNGGGF